MLELTAALAAATVQDKARAQDWLDAQAGVLAARVPDVPDESWMAFSATNVGIWRVAVGVERGCSGGVVLELAGHVDEGRLAGKQGRRAAFFADVGRGLARETQTQRERPSGGCAGPRTPPRSGSGTTRQSGVRSPTCSIALSPWPAGGSCGAWPHAWESRIKPVPMRAGKRHMRVFETLGKRKAVLGMVHLPPLPGTPFYEEGSFARTLARVSEI